MPKYTCFGKSLPLPPVNIRAFADLWDDTLRIFELYQRGIATFADKHLDRTITNNSRNSRAFESFTFGPELISEDWHLSIYLKNSKLSGKMHS